MKMEAKNCLLGLGKHLVENRTAKAAKSLTMTFRCVVSRYLFYEWGESYSVGGGGGGVNFAD